MESCGKTTELSVLRIAIPYSENVLDYKTNYYLDWLQKKTGLSIETVTIRQSDSQEYLDTLFATDSNIDIVLFGEDFLITKQELEKYVKNNNIYETKEGKTYYSSYGSESIGDCGQTLWINSEWLSRLNMPVPRTTEELKKILEAFRDMDPNANGLKDEIPLLGSCENYATNPVELLLNSFVYNDPNNNRMYYDSKGEKSFAPENPHYIKGMEYCRELMNRGLLDSRLYSLALSSFSEILNSRADLVGAFTTDSISDVLYPGNPEIMAKYIVVPPLEGPDGEKNALRVDRKARVGAIITNTSTNKEAAVKLLDTMMTEEASLIARYGEEGVDWEKSAGLDVSIYGSASTIATKNYIWNTPQNKNLNGIGVMNLQDKYLKGVIWNGINSDTEYIDARAQNNYKSALPESICYDTGNDALRAFIDKGLENFISGKTELNDSQWNNFLNEIQARSR